MVRLFLLLPFFAVLLSNCAKSHPAGIADAVQALADCENSKGKTLDAMSKEILGVDFYKAASDAANFSKFIDNLDPRIRERWTESVNNDFLLDAAYMQCARSKMPPIKAFYDGQPSATDQTILMTYFNRPEHYTIYRMLPYVMMAVQNIPAK
jgi:hypothetical protein